MSYLRCSRCGFEAHGVFISHTCPDPAPRPDFLNNPEDWRLEGITNRNQEIADLQKERDALLARIKNFDEQEVAYHDTINKLEAKIKLIERIVVNAIECAHGCTDCNHEVNTCEDFIALQESVTAFTNR